MATRRSGKSVYKRVLLKLSGEALQNPSTGAGLDPQRINEVAQEIADAHALGAELAIVVGGGNIFRGAPGREAGIDRATGDYMGMLATLINSLALQSALERCGTPARVMSAVPLSEAVAEPMQRRRALRHLEQGRIVIFGGGTGNPYFTTDSAAALRASEIGADAVLKGTKVDGVYAADPVKTPRARRYRTLSYAEAIARQLRVMDTAAFALCQESNIPIVVFDFFRRGALARVLRGETVGTRVSAKG